MTDRDRVVEVMADWHERVDRGERPSAEDFIRAHPRLEEELREQFQFLGMLDHVLPATRKLPEGVPSTIGDFELLREIGRGGMGVVYEARQVSMDRLVALKVLSLSITASPHAVRRFQREAKAAGKLHHTNVVPIHAMGQHAGHWYYAMELVEGRTLSDVIAQLRADAAPTEESLARSVVGAETAAASTSIRELGTTTGDRAYFQRLAEVFAGAAEGLHLAHLEGVVHRDIKPSNLMLDVDGNIRIVDFGLARMDDEGSVSMTMTGDLLGTPVYMSPEQAMAKRMTIDHRTDIYSLGATIYEMLTLHPPFDGRTLQEVCTQIITKDPAMPRRRNGTIPRDLETIVLKAMEKDQDRRYASAGDLANDLRRFVAGTVVRARRVGPIGRAWRGVKRHKIRAALVSAVLVLGGVGLWLGTTADREAEQRRGLQYDDLLREARFGIGFSGGLKGFGRADDLGPGRDVVHLLSRAIEVDPRRGEAFWLRALAPDRSVEERQRDIDSAIQREFPERSGRLLRAFVRKQYRKVVSDPLRAVLLAETRGESSTLDLFLEATLLHHEADHDRILEQLDQVLVDAPARSVVRFMALRWRASMRLQSANDSTPDYSGALKDLHALQAVGCNTVKTRAQEAICWRGLGREAQAETIVTALMAETRGAEAWTLACQAFLHHGQFDWLDRVSAQGLREHPQSPHLLRSRGVALGRLGKSTEARAMLDRALAADPSDPITQANLAMTLSEEGHHAESLAAFDRAIELQPLEQGRLRNRFERAHTLMRMRRWGDALVDFNVVLQADPSHWEAWKFKAQTLRMLGRLAEALEASKRAEEEDAWRFSSEPGRLHMERFCILWGLNRREDAVGELERALKFVEERLWPDYQANYGWALIQLERYEDADRALAAVPDADLSSPAVRIDWALCRLAALQKLDRKLESLPFAEIVLDGGRRDPGTANWAAWVRATSADPELRAPEKAVRYATIATSVAPKVQAYWNTLGVALCRVGKWNEALEALETSVALSFGGDACDWFFIAIAQEKLGHREAMESYRKAVRWMEEHKPDREEHKRFRAEAAAVLGVVAAAR